MFGRLMMAATALAASAWSRLRAFRAPEGPAPEAEARPWPPRVGDRVEMFSRWTGKWFPAVVEASGPRPGGGGWPAGMTVRLLGNGTGEDDVLEGELRPLDWLAAARRDPDRFPEHYPAWPSWDRHMIRHMETCGGCPECDGLDRFYPACPDCGSRRHRSDSDPCLCSQYRWLMDRAAGRLLTAAARRDRVTRRARAELLGGAKAKRRLFG